MVSEEHKELSERSWVVTLCDGLGVQGRALSVFHWFPCVLVMPNPPEPQERQMTKPTRTVIPDLAFPSRTKQGPGEGRANCCFGNRWSLRGQCRADQPSCPFGYISCSWCVWEQKMCAVQSGVTNEQGMRWVPGVPGSWCQRDPGAQVPAWTLSPAACPACWVLCRKHLHVNISIWRSNMSLSLTVNVQRPIIKSCCANSPANKMGLLTLLPSTYTKLYPCSQRVLCSKKLPLTQPACTSWVPWSHPKSQEEPLAITAGT